MYHEEKNQPDRKLMKGQKAMLDIPNLCLKNVLGHKQMISENVNKCYQMNRHLKVW
jgi:hypothetical protein